MTLSRSGGSVTGAMSERSGKGPRLSATGRAARKARRARLAEALRDNLKKRKAQARRRTAAAAQAAPDGDREDGGAGGKA